MNSVPEWVGFGRPGDPTLRDEPTIPMRTDEMSDCALCKEFEDNEETHWGWDGYHVEDVLTFAHHFRTERNLARAKIARLERTGDILAEFVKGAEFANPQEWVCGEALREDWQEAKDG